MAAYFANLRLFNRNIYLYFATIFIFGFTFDGGIYTVIFNLYLLRLGYGPEFIGQINSVGLLAFALFSLPAGFMGNRWGNRRMMLAGMSLMVISGILLPFAEFSPGLSQAQWLVLTNILFLLGTSSYFVNTTPFLMNITTPASRNHAFSAQVALWQSAAFAGSLVGGLLPAFFSRLLSLPLHEPAPYRYALFVAALSLAPALPIMLAVREQEPEPSQPALSLPTTPQRHALSLFPWALIFVLILIRFFQVTGIAAIFTFFNVYLDSQLAASTALIGGLTGLGRLLAVVASLLTPLLAARYGNHRLVIWSTLGSAVVMVPLILLPHWAAAGATLLGVMTTTSIRFPAFLVYSMERVSPHYRGIASGAGEMAAGLCFSMVALSGGFIITALGYPALYLLTALLTTLSALIFWAYFRKAGDEQLPPQLGYDPSLA